MIGSDKISPIEKSKFTKHGYDSVLKGYKISDDVTVEQLEKCIKSVMCSLVPMSVDKIEDKLAMLSTLVVKPMGESSDDHVVRIKFLALQLVDYPADIVMYSIDKVAQTVKFWPSYSEFYQTIDGMNDKRLKLLDSLNKKLFDLTA